MRPIYPSDLEQVTRAVCALPQAHWAFATRQIIDRAQTADRFRKRFRRNHPQYGSGTLTSAIPQIGNARGPQFCDTDYLAALAVIITQLQARQHNNM
jgi:hypothetical protein